MKSLPRFAFAAAAVTLIACGGGGSTIAGGGGGGGGGGACGPAFATPNYAQETDPASGRRNFLLRWPRFPVTIAMRNEVVISTPGGNVGSTGPILNGMDNWADATAGGVDYTLLGPGADADIEITVDRVAGPPGAGDFLARTNLTYNTVTLELVKAVMTVRVWPGMTFQEATIGLRSTAAHEFGHALFIVGHSETAADLMYWRGAPDDDKGVRTRDLNTIQTAYCGDFTRSRSQSDPSKGPLATIEFVRTEQGCREH